jgi:hypothetical protein
MATNFSARVTTNEDNFIIAWVDRDDAVCIEQPFNPESGNGATWTSEEEAMIWATAHAEMLAAQPESVDRMADMESKMDQILAALNNPQA